MSKYPPDPNDDDLYPFPTCSVCGSDMEHVRCWYCHGEGEFDEYDDDPVNFAPGELSTPCGECEGRGWYWQCPNVPHEGSAS